MRATISRRPLVLGALSIACGLAALLVGSAAVAAAARAARSSFVTVPVAARPLAEGTVISDGDLSFVRVPPEAAPPGVAAAPVGRTLTLPLLTGDPVTEGKLAPYGRGYSALLHAGEVAASIVPSSPIEVAVGERVRITATFDPLRYHDRDLVRVVAASALVLARDEKSPRLVVGLKERERDQLALAETTARLDVSVLPPGS